MTYDLPITSFAALANGLIYLILTVRVITYRRGNKVVLGDNDDRALTKRIRGHGNAAEQMPLALILIGLCELQGCGGWMLWTAALAFTAGRALHGAYFTVHGLPWQMRFYGMMLTLGAQIALLLMLAWVFVT